MNFSNRKAVSPIIATLLLIAIAVAAGILVYVYVNSLSGGLTGGGGGQQVSSQVEMTSYNFNQLSGAPSGACITGTGAATPCAIVYVKNTGSGSVSLGSVYFDGTLLTETGTLTMTSQGDYTLVLDKTVGSSPTCPASGDCFGGLAASYTAGTSHTIKILSSTGTVITFNIVAGRTG